jgi:tetratricopeptide (TPR) repeat protein
LGEEIGRGGMGLVRRARDLALDRTVAVKILHDKYDPNSATAARFVEEARITAQLQHPGIPAVYHVGRTPAGMPFLAMKLIRGDTLDAILATRSRGEGGPVHVLAVFEAICQAVGYAHAHAVIHRDLKPANVMVGAYGEVQVMDWGLAKILRNSEFGLRNESPKLEMPQTEIRSLRDSDGTVTQAGLVMGTPAYMSPEQAGGEHDRVDRRADVFGLGGILCALLTGAPPYEGSSAESVRLNAVRGETGPALARLDACGAEPEVVALCKRCLRFDPAERPADADVLANEIAALRRASDERARVAEVNKATVEVQLAEQKKRRRLAVNAGAVITAVLTIGFGGTYFGLKRSERAREGEIAQRKTAEAKQAEAAAVLKFIDDKVFSAARPKGQEGGLGREVTLRAALEAALPSLATSFRDQPLVEAKLRTTFGNTLWFLGDFAAAESQYERACTLYAGHDGPPRESLAARYNLAYALMSRNRTDDAIVGFESVLAAQRAAFGETHPDTLATKTGLAHAYESAGRHEEALGLRQAVFDYAKADEGADGVNTLLAAHNLSNSLFSLGRYDDALGLREKTVAAKRRVLGEDNPATLLSGSSLVRSYYQAGRYDEAIRLGEDVLARQKTAIGATHPDRTNTLGGVGLAYSAKGQFDLALARFREKYEAIKARDGADHPEALIALANVAASYGGLNRHDDALAAFTERHTIVAKKFGPDSPEAAAALSKVAACLYLLGRHERSAEVHTQVLARLEKDPDQTQAVRQRLIDSLYELGRGDEARPHVDAFVATARTRKDEGHNVRYVVRLRADFAAKGTDPAEMVRAADLADSLAPADELHPVERAKYRARAAEMYGAAGKPAESGAQAEKAMDLIAKAVAAGFTDANHFETEDAFAALRGREDFKKLVAKLKNKD